MFKNLKKRGLGALLKTGIVLLLGWTLYREVWLAEGATATWAAFRGGIRTDRFLFPLLLVLLMPVNWGLEALKWRRFLAPFYLLELRLAYRAILTGLALSLVTPNRLGDYGGRLLPVPAKHHWRALMATAMSGYCQLLVVLAAGTAGVLMYGAQYWPSLERFSSSATPWLVCGVGVLLAGFYNLERLRRWLARWRPEPWAARLDKKLEPLASFSAPLLTEGLLLAALRYAVYTVQYALALYFCGIEAPLPAALAGIATIFLIQVCLPLPPFAGLLARGEIAILIWGGFPGSELGILAATFGLFIINIAAPALLGAVFIVQTNVFKSFGYEEDSDQVGRAARVGDAPRGFG